MLEFAGPWLLNAKSGWYHKTTELSSEPGALRPVGRSCIFTRAMCGNQTNHVEWASRLVSLLAAFGVARG